MMKTAHRPAGCTFGLVLSIGLSLFWSMNLAALRVEQGPQHSIYHLSYGSPLSSNHTFSKADQDWIRHVEAASQGRIKIKAFWSGTLISSQQNVVELRHGVTDIAMITPIYMHAGMHAIRAQTGFYAGADRIQTQVEVFHCLLQEFPVFSEELEGLTILAVQGGTPSYLLSRNRSIATLDDIAGLRLRTPTALVPVVYALGGDPVLLPMGDVYPAFSKGIIDGVLTPEDTLLSMHFAEIGRYFIQLAMHRGAYPSRAMSLRSWQALPPDLQQIISDSSRFWEERIAHYTLLGNEAALAYGHKNGVEFVSLPESEQQRFNQLYMEIALRDAEALSQYGIAGVEILERVAQLVDNINRGKETGCR